MTPDHRSFVVTGCGRSGTKYTSLLFQELGIPCGHEMHFAPPVGSSTVRLPEGGGDASFAAAPHLLALPEDVVILHQVRHPLDVIRSMHDVGFFDHLPPARSVRADLWWPLRRSASAMLGRPHGGAPVASFQRLVAAHAPEIYRYSSSLERAARYWLSWNELVERAAPGRPYRRFLVEDLDLDTLRSILASIGRPTDGAEGALGRVPSTINRKALGPGIQWSDLPEELANPVRALAGRYGYQR